MRYYKKEIPEAGVYIFGQSFMFDILETADSALIAELDKCVARGVGGVMAITEEQYKEEAQKKTQLNLLNGNSRPPQRQELSALRVDTRRAVEAVANPSPRRGQFAKPQVPPDAFVAQAPRQMPEPIEIPTLESFTIKPPPTMKLSQMKTNQS